VDRRKNEKNAIRRNRVMLDGLFMAMAMPCMHQSNQAHCAHTALHLVCCESKCAYTALHVVCYESNGSDT